MDAKGKAPLFIAEQPPRSKEKGARKIARPFETCINSLHALPVSAPG